jgi:enterochelin esterase-like enzyme
MPYKVWLPPGYDADAAARFPTLYALHGGSGLNSEWIDYGVLAAAEQLMQDRVIPRFIIALPQGDQEYWVDHVVDAATGANGEKWGTYTAKEVVPEIDGHFRTIAAQRARAIGGLSMGGHAAVQLSMNFPGIWSVVGAHSPALRPIGDAPTYLGTGAAEFAARDPLSLIRARPERARGYAWWIDSGSLDPWRAQATALHEALAALGIAHEWQPYEGGHELAYWREHMADYLRYYGRRLG